MTRRWLFLIFFGLVGTAFLIDFLNFSLVCRAYARKALSPTLPKEVSPTEAIVVLTGDRYRIPKALELLRTRESPHLIISGAGRGITLTDLVNQQGDAAINIHSVWKKISLESRSQSTLDNAQETARFVREWHTTRLILVTSEYHMRRSSLIFHKVFPTLDIIEYPVRSDFFYDFSSLPQRPLNGAWNFWVEYWKLLLYRYYFSNQITAEKIFS